MSHDHADILANAAERKSPSKKGMLDLKGEHKSDKPLDTIHFKNIGPIYEAHIKVPVEGGVVILTGEHGVGKSHALTALDDMIRNTGGTTKRDAADVATVEWGDSRLILRQVRRRDPELIFAGLESDLDISALSDPEVKDPLAADQKRIRVLLSLCNAKADIASFYPLLGDKETFDAAIPAQIKAEQDLLTMAAKIKRQLDQGALENEKEALSLKTQYEAEMLAVGEHDVGAVFDPDALNSALESALRDDAALIEKRNNAQSAIETAKTSQAELNELLGSLKGPTLADATAELAAFESAVSLAAEAVNVAEARLTQAEQTHDGLVNDLAEKNRIVESLQQQQVLIDQLQKKADAAKSITVPSCDMIDESSANVDAARAEIRRATLITEAKKHVVTAEKHKSELELKTARATKYREAAKKTDGVLTSLVSTLGTPLYVQDGRLVIDTDRCKGEPYASLSDGERVIIAIKVAVNALPKTPDKIPTVVLKQRVFQDLNERSRKEIAELAKSLGALVVTALPTADAELGAVIL